MNVLQKVCVTALLGFLVSCGGDESGGSTRPACAGPQLSKECLVGEWVFNFDAMNLVANVPLAPAAGEIITITFSMDEATASDAQAPEEFSLTHTKPSGTTTLEGGEWSIGFGDTTLIMDFSLAFGSHDIVGDIRRNYPARLEGTMLKIGGNGGATPVIRVVTPGVPYEEWYEYKP